VQCAPRKVICIAAKRVVTVEAPTTTTRSNVSDEHTLAAYRTINQSSVYTNENVDVEMYLPSSRSIHAQIIHTTKNDLSHTTYVNYIL
jgi:hypothetical protein